MTETKKTLRGLGWSQEEAQWRAEAIDAAKAKIARGVPEWVAKGYKAPLDCANKALHDMTRHGDPSGCGCGCVCDAAGNRLN